MSPEALIVPIGVALIAALVLTFIVVRTLKARRPSKATDSNSAPAGPMAPFGRDRNLPRWLDPSIAAARFKTDTTTAARASAAVAVATAPARLPVVFATPVEDLAERLQVRYDGVPLLDRPDDVLGQTIGELDSGDEVEILEREEIWARVRTPSGTAGWTPTMALSDVEIAVAEPAPDPGPLALANSSDEQPPLEALFAAIAAKRHAQLDLTQGIGGERETVAKAAPAAAKQTRSRTAPSDRPVARPRRSTSPRKPKLSEGT
jgi:Bacterial SH3 domain